MLAATKGSVATPQIPAACPLELYVAHYRHTTLDIFLPAFNA
jgi:hypothetical protein